MGEGYGIHWPALHPHDAVAGLLAGRPEITAVKPGVFLVNLPFQLVRLMPAAGPSRSPGALARDLKRRLSPAQKTRLAKLLSTPGVKVCAS